MKQAVVPACDEYYGDREFNVSIWGAYAFTGTEAVGENVLRALGDRAGVILANHGNVCVGPRILSYNT